MAIYRQADPAIWENGPEFLQAVRRPEGSLSVEIFSKSESVVALYEQAS